MKKTFSNGAEHRAFEDCFCSRCSKCKLDDGGMPLKRNCKIEESIAIAVFEERFFPDKNVMRLESGYWACDSFMAIDKEVQEQYEEQVLPEIKKLKEEAK